MSLISGRIARALAICAALTLALPSLAQQTLKQPPESKPQITLSFAPVVKKVQPAVVNVFAQRVEQHPQQRNPLFDDPIFQRFFGGGRPDEPAARSLGSGVIVDSSGLVVTNHHVIEGMTDVKVALSDKREFDADIVLRDPRTDLAVLRIKGHGPFPVMELGDSDAIEVGDLVLALGNPFGVGQTVTQGIISALARTQVGISDYGFFIQTDAAINPGNSGGALVDMSGRLVGINSAIYSQSGGSIGIGFAIPVNMVKSVIAAAENGGTKVQRPWLGASLQSVSREIADGLGLERPSGALVANVSASSPAGNAGIKSGDVITAVDGQPVDDPEGFSYRLGTKPIGGEAKISLLRGGKQQVVALKLAPAPEMPARDSIKLNNPSPFSGATIVNLSPAVVDEYNVEGVQQGVMVTDVEDGSTAAEVGVQKGDVILSINDQKIGTTREMAAATASKHYYWKLSLARGGQVITTMISG
ncbi:DegQ family serine endoprotease [Methylovirgula sp. 4M-Z18]|uniref:DegQ family serine endoprotease n=1 Tax=Methylovirgula sp. 4M-Z18 TaxID=2293567 RepID=UPI000E2F46FB|nr:DegQ family serine endoprotease [Methylovirgula sp. 4M-Z18]RFB80841.1 DegQ family serine endoprotease [Methylovirgula sp. 4M-Z18]